MDNKVQVFNFEEQSIRTMLIDGKPFFVGKDVAKTLGYKKPLNALATHVDEDDSLKQGLTDSLGRVQETIVINESGLYALIMASQLPEAKKFKHWVTSEVLPAIRKHGGYSAQQAESVDLPRKPVDILRLTVQALDEQNERLDKLEETFEQFKAEEPLSPGEYNYIGKLTGRAVRSFLAVADVNHGVPANREQRSELYRDINTGVLQVTGVRTRANLRKRDFDVVCDYVARWTPSVATRMELERLADREEEFDF
ncbi:BRO family protein [Lactobacillus delbrueckii]|uniref:BRO family protein n=1 Tax=Lactobacillus delbrueckii TaxID=1584 RepID=UPI001E3FCFAA|nr:BRO family protein [Lactobacillus delbrueckii]MCD5446143.1 ORF6C domain-containing protein [Lactobacillus delbrueckii subsp. lactis]